jgi:hypothetical protein
VEYRKISIEGIQLRWNGGRGRLEVFHWRDSENGDRGYVKRAKKKVDGQRKWHPEKKHKGEYKREDTKGRAEAKNITKTAKVRVFERSGFKKKKEEFWDYARQFVETWVEERSWGKIKEIEEK